MSTLLHSSLALPAPLQNESTGTKTFTLFGPAGGGTNLTAFHFETKVREGDPGGCAGAVSDSIQTFSW